MKDNFEEEFPPIPEEVKKEIEGCAEPKTKTVHTQKPEPEKKKKRKPGANIYEGEIQNDGTILMPDGTIYQKMANGSFVNLTKRAAKIAALKQKLGNE